MQGLTDQYNALDLVKMFSEGMSDFDPSIFREGIVVWFINSEGQWDCFKHKSEEFLIRESQNGSRDVEDVL